MLNIAWAFIKRDFQQTMSYKLQFFGSLLGIPLLALVMYFLNNVFDASTSPLLKPYGGNYFAFLLVGIAFIDFAAFGLQGFSQSIRDSQMMGTLEIMLLSPTRLWVLIACSSLGGYLLTSIRVVLYLVAAVFLFRLNMGQADLASAMVILLVSIPCFAGLGIIVASVILVFKEAKFVETLFNLAFVMLGGVIYPVEALPALLQQFAGWLPITHALRGMRGALMQGLPMHAMLPEILALLAFTIVFLSIGLMAFGLAVRRVKVTGTLTHY